MPSETLTSCWMFRPNGAQNVRYWHGFQMAPDCRPETLANNPKIYIDPVLKCFSHLKPKLG